MDNIVIREVIPDDAAKIIKFISKIGGESDNFSFGTEGIGISVEQEMTNIKEIISDRHSVFYIALKENEIVGDVSLAGLSRRMNHRAELSIAVAKSEWGKGLGYRLMNIAINYAKENSIEIINLAVRSDNQRAIRLYEKCGFVKMGISPAFLKINNDYFDVDEMILDLREASR